MWIWSIYAIIDDVSIIGLYKPLLIVTGSNKFSFLFFFEFLLATLPKIIIYTVAAVLSNGCLLVVLLDKALNK